MSAVMVVCEGNTEQAFVRRVLGIAERIGLDRLRASCRHFNEWLTAIELRVK